MGSNWGRQLSWGSSQDHFEGLQGPSQRGGHGYIRACRKIGGGGNIGKQGRSKMKKKMRLIIM